MKRSVIFVALAALAATLASVVVYSALKKRDAEVQQAMAKTINIVVATADLPLGTKIEPGQIKLTKWSADGMPNGAFTDPGQVVGSFVKSQFVANEPIVASKLFMGQKTAGVMPLLIPPGMRAVSVPVDEVSDIAGFVLPHTHVDILVALGQGGSGGEKPFSKIVLQNVEVLAVAQEVEQKKDQPELVRVVTLLVSPQDAERLALASREGVLRLAMRNYADSKIVLTSGSDIPQMLHAYAAAVMPVMAVQGHAARRALPVNPVKKYQVEIFRDGKSSESVSFVSQALAEPSRPNGVASTDTGHKAAESAAAEKVAAGAATNSARAGAPQALRAEPAAYLPAPKVIDVP